MEMNQVNVQNNITIITVENILIKLRQYFRGEKSINFPSDRDVIIQTLTLLNDHLITPSNNDTVSSKEIVLFFNKTCYQWIRFQDMSLAIIQVLVSLQELQQKIPTDMLPVILLPGGMKIILKSLKCHLSNYQIIKYVFQLIESISLITTTSPYNYDNNEESIQYIIQGMLNNGVGYCIPKLLTYVSTHVDDVWSNTICLKWFLFVINNTPCDYIYKIVSYDDWTTITALTRLIDHQSDYIMKELLFFILSLSAAHINISTRLYTSGSLSKFQIKLRDYIEDLSDYQVNGLDKALVNLKKINDESNGDIDSMIIYLDNLKLKILNQIEKNQIPISDDLDSVYNDESIGFDNSSIAYTANSSLQTLHSKRLSIHLPTFSPSHSSIPLARVHTVINTYPKSPTNTYSDSNSFRSNTRSLGTRQTLQPIVFPLTKPLSPKVDTQSSKSSVKTLHLVLPDIDDLLVSNSTKTPTSPATISNRLLTSPFGQPMNAHTFKNTQYDHEKQFIPRSLGGTESATPLGKQKFSINTPSLVSRSTMVSPKNMLHRGLSLKGLNSNTNTNQLVTRVNSNKQLTDKILIDNKSDLQMSFNHKLNALIANIREETSSFKEVNE